MLDDSIALQERAPAHPRPGVLLATLSAVVVLLVVIAAAWKMVPHEWASSGGGPEPRGITLQFRNADVSVVLRAIALQSGATLALDPKLTGTISIETRDAKLSELMNNFCAAYSCTWSLSGGSQPALVVRRSSSSSPDQSKS